jgi:hypothetical protein
VALLPVEAKAAASPPSYSVRFLGAGAPTAINEANTVVGYRTSVSTGRLEPLISTGGGAWTTLPLPAGALAAFATDVNDSAVVVGVADLPAGRRAVRWTPSGGSHVPEVLPLLAGETTAYATAVNNQGQVVGARAGILGTPFGYGWVYSDAAGMVGLLAGYGWDAAAPDDINDHGVILDGTQTFDLTTGTVADVGTLIYPPVGGVALNDAGQILGVNITSGSLPTIRVQRYTPGAGWLFITGTSRYTVATDLNEGGDLTYSEGLANAPGLYLDGLGLFPLNDLLDPAARAAGWLAVGGGSRINDAQVIATGAKNTITGQTGTVLLTPTTPTTAVRVARIALSASVGQGVATTTGVVTVRTAAGALVPNAVVAATWDLPGGGTAAVTATTSARGKATFITSGPRGTYRLTITGVTGTGLTFDPASSVLTKSITV